MIQPDNKYTAMQLNSYNNEALTWSEDSPDAVVGSFHAHNNWPDYELLFKGITDTAKKRILDFACGPGRNIVKYKDRFEQIDGVDISPVNIEKAQCYLASRNITNSVLYTCNGVDLSVIDSEIYDIVMSTIALQHICVYEIRKNIFKDIYRVLKTGGIFTAQMGFGSPSPSTVNYYDNYYEAPGTNRACDVCIETPDQLKKDLIEIGFSKFKYTITQTGPGDTHPNWIFFNSIKC
jgi:ubiquinone/menaquinone biosynthesis C-methylase UbiE